MLLIKASCKEVASMVFNKRNLSFMFFLFVGIIQGFIGELLGELGVLLGKLANNF